MPHFLGCIHRLKDAIVSRDVHHTCLSAKILSDLRLFLVFLNQAHEGMSMHLLTYCTPYHHHRADACGKGIGGYGMATGKAWHWETPQEYWGKFTLNSLEFITSFISFWSGILDSTIKSGDCILSKTDITSVQGWLCISNFDDSDQAIQMLIAHKMTKTVNATGIVLYSQWLPRKENIVYDCLSHNYNMPDPDLVHMLHLFIPEQIAEDFIVNQLPSEIISFIFSLMQKMPEMMPSPKEQPRTPIDPGNDGLSSVNKSELQTHYLSSLKSQKGTESLAPFVKPRAKEPSHQEGSRNSSLGRAEPPWTTWCKPSELWTDPTQPTIRRHRGHHIPLTETILWMSKLRSRQGATESDHTQLLDEIDQPVVVTSGCDHLSTYHRGLVLHMLILRLLHHTHHRAANKSHMPSKYSFLPHQQGAGTYGSTYFTCRYSDVEVRICHPTSHSRFFAMTCP
jgi:hypothetical protein